jgi:secondary thiamine-phosphate synthase enzyme
MEETRLLDRAVEVRQEMNGNGHFPLAAGATGVFCESIAVRTSMAPDFVDLTDRVNEILDRTRVRNGFVVIFSKHTTAAVRINENETCLKRDMARVLERIAPCDEYYEHNDLEIRTENLTDDEDLNGHAHCIHMLMGASESIPVIDGKLTLGRWQRIFLIELDKARNREVLVQVIGL